MNNHAVIMSIFVDNMYYTYRYGWVKYVDLLVCMYHGDTR
jgi:hypothetical protein